MDLDNFHSVLKCSENLVEDEVELQKLELDSLLPEVKGRILEHLDYEDILKLRCVSKTWKALIESVEFIQALSLKAWQWAGFASALKKQKSGGRSLQVYPEYACVPSATRRFEDLPESIKHSILGLPRSIRLFILGCILRFENLPRSIRHFILGVVAFSTFPSVAGASPASAPGLSSSQMSSTYPPLWYAGIGATMVGGACAFTALVAGMYRHFYPRERGDGLRAVLEVLTSPFQERERVEERVLHMNVGNVNVGKDSVGDFSLRSSPGSSPV